MKLYYDPRTVNCRKVVAGFKLMDVEFESENVDYFTQGQKAPDNRFRSYLCRTNRPLRCCLSTI